MILIDFYYSLLVIIFPVGLRYYAQWLIMLFHRARQACISKVKVLSVIGRLSISVPL